MPWKPSTLPAAIERALAIYLQMQARDQSVIVQARKILTQHIYGMVDRGERDEKRLTVGGLAHLKAVEREHGIKSAHGGEPSSAACPLAHSSQLPFKSRGAA